MLWAPKNHQIGDVTIIRVGAEYHLFSEMRPLVKGPRIVGHARSTDMFQWEELPAAITIGPAGAFDGSDIYHIDVFVHEGTWHLFYTGLDKFGPGQQQSIGLATSKDGLQWTKQGNGPVLRADPRWYEPAIPREATYQEKDFGRLWFRDPYVWQDPATKQFQMIVIARDKSQHLDVRGCIALATSKDLLSWTPQPPLYSPGRFHTIETPSLFEHRGRHYLMFLTHWNWGPPIMATDPYQTAGNFYAVSEHGWQGPYVQPADEVVVAAHETLRMGAERTVVGPDGERFLYGWLRMDSHGDDIPQKPVQGQVLPPPNRVRFTDDGQMQVKYYEKIEEFTEPTAIVPEARAQLTPLDADHWQTKDVVIGKNLIGRSAALLPGEHVDFIFSARLSFLRGERAGLVLRSDEKATTGWQVVADRRFGRIEFGTLSGDRFIDARKWNPTAEVELKVVANGPSVEIYADDQLMIHQVRYRETTGRVGYFVEHAEARFERPWLRRFRH